MRKSALPLLILGLVAFGCDVGALCAATQAVDGSCCCPMAMAMDMGDAARSLPPCMEESDGAPMPLDSRATFDGVSQAGCAPPTTVLSLPTAGASGFDAWAEFNPAAGHGPALYLLGCSFLN